MPKKGDALLVLEIRSEIVELSTELVKMYTESMTRKARQNTLSR